MDTRINELALDVEELKKFEGMAERETVKAKLTVLRSQFQQELSVLKERKAQTSNTTTAPTKAPTKTKVFTKKITTYAWDQSDKFVKIFVSGLEGVGDIPKEDVQLTHNGSHYCLNILNLKKSNYRFDVPKLAKEVVTPTLKIKRDEIVIMLKKASSGKWETLTEREKNEKYKKDDIKFDKGKETDDPSKGIMDLMKKMYDDGDDEMKRTIAKAWTESRDKQMTGEPAL